MSEKFSWNIVLRNFRGNPEKAPLRRSDEECDGGGACDQQLAVLCRRPRLPLMNLCKLLIWKQGGSEGDEDVLNFPSR